MKNFLVILFTLFVLSAYSTAKKSGTTWISEYDGSYLFLGDDGSFTGSGEDYSGSGTYTISSFDGYAVYILYQSGIENATEFNGFDKLYTLKTSEGEKHFIVKVSGDTMYVMGAMVSEKRIIAHAFEMHEDYSKKHTKQ